MLNIAVIQRFLPSVSRGGAGYFTHGLCNALRKRSHQVTIFSQDPAPKDADYQVVRIEVKGRYAPFTFPIQISKKDFSDFDLIHAQGDDQFIPRNAPPVVRTMHGSSLSEAIHNGLFRFSPKHFLLHLYFYFWELIATTRADSVVVVSRKTGKHYWNVDAVIPNGIDIEVFSGIEENKSKNPTILFVGDLSNRKRGKLLLDIFKKTVREKIPEAELWMVCPQKIEEYGVRTFDSVNSEKLSELYRQAWVFCLPSSYEGFGRPYVEAMAAGTPVISTRNPGAIEILDHGRFGFITNDSKLGDALCTFLNDSTMRKKFAELGRERAQQYHWDRVVEQYERIYEKVLSYSVNKIPPQGHEDPQKI